MPSLPTVDLDTASRTIKISLPPSLLVTGRDIPGARFNKYNGVWTAPATWATADFLWDEYRDREHGLNASREFLLYHAGARRGYDAAHAARSADKWPHIPITAVQPEGKWLHQRRAFWFAYPLEASMLAVTMGGGKTKIAIDLMQNWGARDVLVISPLAACEDAWEPQLDKYVMGGYQLARAYTGPLTRRIQAAETVFGENETDHRIVLINHEAFWREPFRSYVAGRGWDLIIADELHREKGAGSKQSAFLSQLGARAKRRLGLTGTPMPHSPLDVYGQYRFLDRGVYGTNFARFQQRYAEFGGFKDREVTGFKNLDDLHRRFFKIAIKVDDSEQGLPRTVDVERKVKLDASTRKIYDDMGKGFIAHIKEGTATAKNVGVKLLRLHQIACGIVAVGEGKAIQTSRHSQEKLLSLQDFLNHEAPDEEPVVIFTRFALDTRHIAQRFGALEVSGEKNELKEWKAGKHPWLVAQIQAVKEGVDLTRAAIGVFYSTGVSLGDYEQCRKRLHRPPQARMVRFIHILASGTRDVSTMRALRERRDVIADALDEAKRS